MEAISRDWRQSARNVLGCVMCAAVIAYIVLGPGPAWPIQLLHLSFALLLAVGFPEAQPDNRVRLELAIRSGMILLMTPFMLGLAVFWWQQQDVISGIAAGVIAILLFKICIKNLIGYFFATAAKKRTAIL